MKVVIFSNAQLFLKASKETCKNMECQSINIWQIRALEKIIQNIPPNLVIIDYNTFRQSQKAPSAFLNEITKYSYLLIVETISHELDRDSLLAQISKQCKIEEIYFYQQFVKKFCQNYWNIQNNDDLENIEEYKYPYQNEMMKMEPVCRKIYGYLNSHKNTPVSIINLCNHVWGIANINKRKAIYVYIRKIRVFINDNLENPEKLIKIGKGFYTLR